MKPPFSPPRLKLHEVEARILHNIRTKWAGVEENVGLLQVFEGFSTHWTLRDWYKELVRDRIANPEPETLYLLADFKDRDGAFYVQRATPRAPSAPLPPREELGK